jgi:hypothetical protein
MFDDALQAAQMALVMVAVAAVMSSIETTGRLQPKQLVAITRCAQVMLTLVVVLVRAR